ncbi:hypothetical protein ISCGN_013858 [Ixodes scapularis]
MGQRGWTLRGVMCNGANEDEILAGLQKQAVVAVKRITIRKDGQEQPTKHLILTFELHTLPTTVKAESKATQVSPEVLAVALQSPTPQQRQQPPPVSGGSAPAASRPRDRQGTPLSVPTPRAPAREKERESRPNSRERTSSKERHRAAPSTAEGQGQMELGDAQPSTSTTAPLSEGGRGRGVRPRASTLPRPIQQASSQEVEAKDEATELSALSSDQDDMEWETTKSKKKTKKPGLLEGSLQLLLGRGIGVARGIAELQDGHTVALVTNFRQEAQHLTKGTAVGHAEELVDSAAIAGIAEDISSGPHEATPHSQFDIDPVLPTPQRRQLSDLLAEFMVVLHSLAHHFLLYLTTVTPPPSRQSP